MRPAGKPDGGNDVKATNLQLHSTTGNCPTVSHPVTLGAREREMVQALGGKPLTRVELARIRPRLGLNATGTVARLRRKGIQIESIWHKITDAEGRNVRFVSYRLIGTVFGVES